LKKTSYKEHRENFYLGKLHSYPGMKSKITNLIILKMLTVIEDQSKTELTGNSFYNAETFWERGNFHKAKNTDVCRRDLKYDN